MPRILFADDDAETRRQLGQALEESGHVVTVASSGERAIALMQDGELDLIITDLVMGNLGGLEVLDAARKHQADAPVLILTGQGSIETAVDAMRRGALDYITKPINLDRLELTIEKAMASRRLLKENTELRAKLDARRGNNILGTSPQTLALLADIERVADTNTTVLVLGPSGSGKELVAEGVHRLSARADKPLIKVNCAALVEGVLESELFGHERGAYTGAHRARQGRFEAANGGTIFLDEIGDLSVSSQLVLFRVLQERTIERVGATVPIPIDVRVVAATNKDLEQAVQEGSFREELYYRLSVVTLRIPPLSERRGDIPVLIAAFIDEFNSLHNRETRGLSPEAMRLLSRYEWPGNIRELRNCIESLVVMSRRELIQAKDLPAHVRGLPNSGDVVIPVGQTLEEASAQYLLRTLESVAGNKTKAARVLGIGTKTLYRKLQDMGQYGE